MATRTEFNCRRGKAKVHIKKIKKNFELFLSFSVIFLSLGVTLDNVLFVPSYILFHGGIMELLLFKILPQMIIPVISALPVTAVSEYSGCCADSPDSELRQNMMVLLLEFTAFKTYT